MRTLKPEFCTSEAISALSERAELHFAKLWTYADDEGRGVDNARLIKAACWPLRDTVSIEDVEALQVELAEAGRIRRYVAGQRAYFQVTNWAEHQHPQKPKPSVIPPETSGTGTAKRRKRTVPIRDSDGTDTGAISPVVVVGEVVVEGEGEGASGGALAFERFWASYPPRDGKQLGKTKAEGYWSKMTEAEHEAAIVGARNLAHAIAAGGKFGPPDAERWLRDRKWPDWQEPAQVGNGHRPAAVQYTSAFRQNPNR